MNISKILHTTGLFIEGSYLLVNGVHTARTLTTQASPTTLIQTGGRLLFFIIPIEAITRKIFDNLGWQSSEELSLVVWLITVISSIALTAATTAKPRIVLILVLVIVQVVNGLFSLLCGVDNIVSNANHKAFISRLLIV